MDKNVINLLIKPQYKKDIYLVLEVSTGFKYWINDTVVDFLFNAQGKEPIEAIKKKLIKKYNIKNYEDRLLSLLKFFKKIGWIQNSTTSNINKSILLNCLPIEYQLDNLTICITNRCNFDCVYCYNKISDKSDFPQDKLFDLLESSLDECGIMSVTITGGEPLLYENLFSVIKYIKRLNRQCNLLTNGSLLTFEKIDELKKVGLDKIGISLDSIDEDIYRQLTNSDKSLNNIIKYIKYCNNIGLSIDINTVFVEGLNFNNNNLKEIRALLKSIGITSHVYAEATPTNNYFNVDELLKSKNYRKHVKEIIGDKDIAENNLKECNLPFCGIGKMNLTILPNGNVIICPTLQEFIVGNVFDSSLDEIWCNSAELKRIREVKISEYTVCKDCSKKYSCRGGCRAKAYHYYKDLTLPDPISCMQYNEL